MGNEITLTRAEFSAALNRSCDMGYRRGFAEARHRARRPWRLAAIVAALAGPPVLFFAWFGGAL